eukprot:CAMPEP_0184360466 /NCGR_PEP_ID=MMETSP1089-20130417/125148_1 /TAXON_ID=38269 ORGANISM="Gloeochaete wittrockiana, Strain SAG46.84" /NCGR_SAMPLE_ID=MMETSP1089 /ASSEMBLY_ACC=CAM_ASM_000445 /LENGTH=116 /DNA_ID=CAMNT_0026699665 /DNA_START=70 /DNA_END=416 /DNA_ORIENTATION=-
MEDKYNQYRPQSLVLDEKTGESLPYFTILAQHFHLPLHQAAERLGLCTSALKKVCRRNGIKKWPYRKLRAIETMIDKRQTKLFFAPSDGEIVRQIQDQIDQLTSLREHIYTGDPTA